MTDRAYIVSRTLENKIAIAENNDQNTLFVTLDVLKEILALLKEQEAVVRCKDCINWDNHTEECSNSDSTCFRNGWCKPDWFCADGEKSKSM